MTTFLFYLFAILTVVAAAGVITARSPIYSAMSLVGTFFSLAAIYALLLAHTIAVLQILVYAGAIMVLFLFVIMLLSLGDPVGPAQVTVPRVVGGIASAALFALLVVAARPFVPAGGQVQPGFGTLQSIGAQLYTQWLAPFEAVSLLLLVAMVGAVVVAKARV